MGDASAQARYGEILAIGEFRALLIGQTQPRFGDQLARVALVLSVYSQTASAILTALAYALTLLPPLLTAPFLAGLADRHSRRAVRVVTDLLLGTANRRFAGPLDCAVHGGPPGGEQLGEFGSGVFSCAAGPDEMVLLGGGELRRLAPQPALGLGDLHAFAGSHPDQV